MVSDRGKIVPPTIPSYRCHHHACRQLPIVLCPNDLAAVVPQGDVQGLGVERARVRGRHRHDAQVSHIPESCVQVVHRCAEGVQVSDIKKYRMLFKVNCVFFIGKLQLSSTDSSIHGPWMLILALT